MRGSRQEGRGSVQKPDSRPVRKRPVLGDAQEGGGQDPSGAGKDKGPGPRERLGGGSGKPCGAGRRILDQWDK
nr:hypothetical protein [Bacillaceae bacterium]